MATVYLDVKEFGTDKVVQTVEVKAEPGSRTVERTMSGMLINMDTDKFYIEERGDQPAIGGEMATAQRVYAALGGTPPVVDRSDDVGWYWRRIARMALNHYEELDTTYDNKHVVQSQRWGKLAKQMRAGVKALADG